jgi:hypothetical protein
MKPDDIQWQSVERTMLPDVLFGKRPSGPSAWRLADALSEGRGAALGYSDKYEEGEYCPPALIAIEDHVAAEVLSWLRTYAPSTFPLNQFARVILRSDWEQLTENPTLLARPAQRGDKWASVVLGELLAQGDMGLDIGNLPLSRCTSCFSTAIARSAIVHSSRGEVSRECIERLVQVENDEAFSRRSVSVRSLVPVWRLSDQVGARSLEVHEVVAMVLEPLIAGSGEPSPLQELIREMLAPHGAFFSDSVETRVLAFQKLSASVVEASARVDCPSELALVSAAAGAFLVGRGTSHAFLLSRLGRKWAQAFVWFGLMGGLSGPGSWEQTWSLAVKGIERFIRGRFDWCEASGADLSWAEYFWISKQLSETPVFLDLPKSLPKALTIEIVPGAICQLRLAADPGGVARSPSIAGSGDADLIDYELRNTLDQLANLATRARHLLGSRTPGQISLGLGNSDTERAKVPQSRRRRRP